MKEQDNSLDILGVKPVANSVEKLTDGAMNGASAFLSRICLPAAEEFGLLLKDKVSSWRAKNAVSIANKAQSLLESQANSIILHAHPRIVYSTIDHGSWAEDDFMQNLWAGILTSSCTTDGKDESNLILINLLSQLTKSQAQLICHICNTCKVFQTEAGWIGALKLEMELDSLISTMAIDDVHQIDRELDHLKSLGLIMSGFDVENTNANVTPTPLCLNLYARAQGYVGNPSDFFNAPVMKSDEIRRGFL
jgi:hypothetical protein